MIINTLSFTFLIPFRLMNRFDINIVPKVNTTRVEIFYFSFDQDSENVFIII